MNTLAVSFLLILANYLFITYAFRRFGLIGLYTCVPITIILANIQVVVTIDIAGIAITLGNVAYASSYLITDLLGELYGEKPAKRAVEIGFFTLIMMTVIMNIVLLYTPMDTSVETFQSLVNIFSLMPRIAIASLIAYAISQRIDVYIYHRLKLKEQDKRLWVRNNASTIFSQLVDTFVFTAIAFTGVMPTAILGQIFLSTYVVKVLVALVDTPFMYLGVKMANKYKIDERIRKEMANNEI